MKLTPEPHPNPIRVAWVDKTTIPVTERYLVPLNFATYRDQVWCDVLPMDVGHILLGRPWWYDHDVTHYGRQNTYTFTHDKKKIVLRPHRPKPIQYSTSQSNARNGPTISKENRLVEQTRPLYFLNKKQFCMEASSAVVYALVVREVEKPSLEPDLPLNLRNLLSDYSDLTPDELPDELPPMRDIQHAIDLVPGSSLPNLPHYRMNPKEHGELKRQVEDLVRKGFIRESMSPCAVPALLTPRKDGT
ncbi:uncharacterized protein LOC109714604 [Ananas comosus]|uniref:Uncharacterized protein LOC109714604 n=1 Tax=Ananas comosus TaxID=4615 RepID=A0A6P5FN35_ANACO|nr:uncharacterized protein LOC109714604 [Ananas comosus]